MALDRTERRDKDIFDSRDPSHELGDLVSSSSITNKSLIHMSNLTFLMKNNSTISKEHNTSLQPGSAPFEVKNYYIYGLLILFRSDQATNK